MPPWSKYVRLLLLTPLLVSLTGCSRSSQAARPQQPCPPATVKLITDRPPCDLPTWPAKPAIGGVRERDAQGNETGRLLVTRDGLAEIGRYVAGALAWAEAAGECLQ